MQSITKRIYMVLLAESLIVDEITEENEWLGFYNVIPPKPFKMVSIVSVPGSVTIGVMDHNESPGQMEYFAVYSRSKDSGEADLKANQIRNILHRLGDISFDDEKISRILALSPVIEIPKDQLDCFSYVVSYKALRTT